MCSTAISSPAKYCACPLSSKHLCGSPRLLAARQGPGTSLQFALKIVEKLYSIEKAEELAKGLLCTTA